MDSQVSETTQLLLAWADGDSAALDALAPRVKRAASRHGGGLGRIDLDDIPNLDLNKRNDKRLIALSDALDELSDADPRKAKIVELRYFGGLSVEETGAVLKVSVETVTRDWRLARGWLLLQIRGAHRSGEST